MLSLNNLSYYLGSRPLYEDISLHIKPKDKIGLIGANGTGKSTLLKLIIGDLTPDEGSISRSNDCTIGFLNQDLLSYESQDSILEVAMKAFEKENFLKKEIDKVLEAMDANYTDELLDKLTKLQEQFEILEGYTIQSKAEEILEGLGFQTADLVKPLNTFSGGWRMRVMLAKLLLVRPSLLMLDEPTNHLDLPSIQWIEDYLSKYEGAIIIVSHDREFLDRSAKSIVEISSRNLNIYAGNYSFYLEEKSLRSEIQKSAFENQQQKIKQTEKFIERFKAKATKARQVQSRVKSLERLDIIDDVIDETAKVNFRFNFKTQPGRHIVKFEDVSKSYGDLKILEKSTVTIERGDKIALVGANGKGKSTLLRIISGTEPINGKVELGHNVNMSFFAQHQLESLNIENTLLEELKQAGTDKTEMELRSVLGCFLFSSDEVFKKIKVLSGGEKSRVALAKVLISESNFLLLDEPTNHLDMTSVNILTQALLQYAGTYIIVSHDRHFVKNVANKIWYIENQEIKEYPGTFDEYLVWRSQKPTEKPVSTPSPISIVAKAPVIKEKSNSEQNELKKLKREIQKTEENIINLEATKNQLEAEMAKPDVFGNPDKLAEVNKKYQEIAEQVDLLNKEWEKTAMEIDNLEN
jgi:ATP-binding cassette subfamily F protein 3